MFAFGCSITFGLGATSIGVIFFGGDEYSSGFLSLKNMKTGEQKQIPMDSLENVALD